MIADKHLRGVFLAGSIGVGLGILGCAWSPRPYARDPLVRQGQAVRKNTVFVNEAEPPPDPQPPLPPLLHAGDS